MHTPQEIMKAIRNGLDSIPSAIGATPKKDRTLVIKTKLCEIGCQAPFHCTVCAALPRENRTHGEWLYDVIWLKYHEKLDDHPICCVPLVAECEWATYAHIKEDFQKLLLARASVRLMIYRDPTLHDYVWQGAEWTAKRLASHVNRFNHSCTEDAWLLAACRKTKDNSGSAFTYFTIRNDQVFIIRPDGTEDPQA